MPTPIRLSSSATHAPTLCAGVMERAGLVALRATGPERIVAIYGPAGAGKSHTAARVVAQHNAVFLRLRVVDSARTIAANLCTELQIRPGKTTAECVDLVVRELRARPRLIVLDEFGFIVGARGVHLVRDLHDETEAKFLVIGDDLLRRQLERHRDRAFHDRVILWQETLPLSVDDVALLAAVYVPAVKIEDDLLELLQQECGGNCRVTVNALRRVAEVAKVDCLDRLDAKGWKDRTKAAAQPSLRVVR